VSCLVERFDTPPQNSGRSHKTVSGDDGPRRNETMQAQRGPQMSWGMRAPLFQQVRKAMTADQFVEFVASVPPEKQVGVLTRLTRLLESARKIRAINGLNLDPVTKVSTTARA
jgi:hypothetical protein